MQAHLCCVQHYEPPAVPQVYTVVAVGHVQRLWMGSNVSGGEHVSMSSDTLSALNKHKMHAWTERLSNQLQGTTKPHWGSEAGCAQP